MTGISELAIGEVYLRGVGRFVENETASDRPVHMEWAMIAMLYWVLGVWR